MSRASSIHEAEREHAVGELKPFDKLNPFKRSARRTPSGRLEDVALAPALAIPGAPANPTPTYIPASFGDSSSSPLVRNGSRPAVPGLFGGAAPDERDHGYPAPASAEEAKERDLRREQSRARRALAQPRGNEAGLTRGPSLVEAAANLATAGFGLGESNAEVVQRTLSRVSTHRSYTARPGQSAPRTITHPAHHEDSSSSSGQTIIGSDETDQEKKARQEVADAGVGLNGGEGGNATNARRIADAEKGASAPEQDHDMSEEELFMARFEPGEKINPKEWSVAYRWYITGLGSLLVLNSTFASSAPSGVVREMIEYFGFGREVATLTVSLFVAGYCVGPLLWGPFSESYGRRPIFIVSFIGYIGFQVGCALSKNTASILIFRFLGGTFASCPLTNAGALLADIWDADRRGIAMALFGLAPFAGPATAPMIAGYIGVSGTSWRWLFWVLCFFASFCGLLVLFTLPETYAPILLVKKAQILRKETGDDRWWAPLEKQDKSFGTVVKNVLVKPFKILALEPMLIAITVYMSFVYGCLYLLFEAYPIVFTQGHGFNAGATGLMFLGLFVGGVLSTLTYIFIFDKRYRKKVIHHAPANVPPEARLEMTLLVAPLFAVSFFWFGWTSYPSVHWASPMCAGGLLGFTVLGIFVSLFNYVVDTYLFAAASALAANTVCRSIFGAAFPLFATQMFEALNPRWASTLLGCIAAIMIPIPFVLITYGPTLRSKSKFSPNKK